jgi:hypothetical protein
MTEEELINKIEWVNKRSSLRDEPLTRNQKELLMFVFADNVVNEKLRVGDVILRFKLRLNVEKWGMYKKGDEDYFNIKLHDKQNGLTRFPIDKRWDVISCEIVNVS